MQPSPRVLRVKAPLHIEPHPLIKPIGHIILTLLHSQHEIMPYHYQSRLFRDLSGLSIVRLQLISDFEWYSLPLLKELSRLVSQDEPGLGVLVSYYLRPYLFITEVLLVFEKTNISDVKGPIYPL